MMMNYGIHRIHGMGLLAIAALGTSLAVFADAPTVLFVDANNGSDDYSGERDRPFRTIQHAVDESVTNGMVMVAPGTYYECVLI